MKKIITCSPVVNVIVLSTTDAHNYQRTKFKHSLKKETDLHTIIRVGKIEEKKEEKDQRKNNGIIYGA